MVDSQNCAGPSVLVEPLNQGDGELLEPVLESSDAAFGEEGLHGFPPKPVVIMVDSHSVGACAGTLAFNVNGKRQECFVHEVVRTIKVHSISKTWQGVCLPDRAPDI